MMLGHFPQHKNSHITGAVEMFDKLEKIAAYIALALLVGSLLPVAYLGRYNHPTGDDYYYGAQTKQVWEATGSVAQVVQEALRGVAENYEQWQGTYSALFLMYLPPNIFSEQAYHFVTGMLLLLLTGGIFYLMKPLICGKLQGSAPSWIIVSSVLCFLCVQTVSFQGESFFWYNGSMYYTGYFAVILFFFGMVFRYLESNQEWFLVPLGLLGIFLGGGNYVSLLPCILLMFTLTAMLAFLKSRKMWGAGGISLLLTTCLLVSAAAPGNQVRQSGMWKIPAWKAVIKSLVQGIAYLDAWMGKWWLLGALILTPVFWRLCKKKTEWSFGYPLLVAGYLFGIFCSMSCPLFYTMNSTGPARAVAIVYYGFILFSYAGYFYLVRYVSKRIEYKAEKKLCYSGICLAALLLAMLVFGGKLEQSTAVKAVKLLVNGEAQAYEQEYRERMKLLTDDSLEEVVLAPYENQPEMLYVGDFSSDPEEETCKKAAVYFGKKAVSVNHLP